MSHSGNLSKCIQKALVSRNPVIIKPLRGLTISYLSFMKAEQFPIKGCSKSKVRTRISHVDARNIANIFTLKNILIVV